MKLSPVDFNAQFVARMVPKVQWAALLQAAQSVSEGRGLRWEGLGPGNEGDIGQWGGRGYSGLAPPPAGDSSPLSPQLGHGSDLPPEPAPGYESDEDFLRRLHHVLLEVRSPMPPPPFPAHRCPHLPTPCRLSHGPWKPPRHPPLVPKLPQTTHGPPHHLYGTTALSTLP